MTVRELYDYAVENGAEDYEIVQRDCLGNLMNTFSSVDCDVEVDHARQEIDML